MGVGANVPSIAKSAGLAPSSKLRLGECSYISDGIAKNEAGHPNLETPDLKDLLSKFLRVDCSAYMVRSRFNFQSEFAIPRWITGKDVDIAAQNRIDCGAYGEVWKVNPEISLSAKMSHRCVISQQVRYYLAWISPK